ncbi:hypothetical protein L211DRAFT_899505 [Terfezia boudieri ATCC MYA-4762]|uniref:Uncharacterized protein n=1 Tax=Terfezia boudieri ATCC MYA-4762 TaxID=1051890 RepID=A0A3N4LLV7_9PEZI|nr:hypothetical protein L211DRAFT_899505 [Terfezia boudieri ATCC MYA-4762]
MPDKGMRKDIPGKEDRVNPPHKTRIPVTDHPQPPSPVIPPVIPSNTDSDTGILDTRLFNAAMNVYYRINLFSSYYQGNTAKNLTDKRVATRSVSTDSEDSEWTVAKWERLQREHAKFKEDSARLAKNYLFKSRELQAIRRELEEKKEELISAKSEIATLRHLTPPETDSNTDPPSSPAQVDSSTQTIPPIVPPTPKPKPPTNSVSTNTDPPPKRTYAEAATTTNSPHNHRESDTSSEHPNLTTQARQAVVLHAAPTKYKPGLMRRWIEEDNKTAAQIQGIR